MLKNMNRIWLLVIYVTVVNISCISSMVLRFNDKGLHGLADYTRTWMNYTIGEMSIDSYSHKIQKGIAAGDLNLQNISVSRFFPPLIRYRSNEHSLYMTTLGGQVELQAEWELESAFLSLFTFPVRGEVLGRIAGLQSEISVQINPSTNEFSIHHCTAKFHDFRIRLSGSMAADILHWFRTILGKAMKRKVEETYCKMISEKLLPWLQHQITKFPGYLEIKFGDNIKLSQSLHSISMTNSHIDLRMKNKFITNGHLIETLSTLPSSIPNQDLESLYNQKMLELFIDEPTLQEVVSAAHFSDQFKANITSPFLKTECEMLCLGTLFPDLGAELGPTSLIVEVKTLASPIIRLFEKRAFVFLNASVEIFDANSLKRNGSSISAIKRENDIIDNNVDITNPVLLDPVISIEVSGEAELFLIIENRMLEGKLRLRNTKAIVMESKLSDMSQKTVDFIVNLSTPFVEDAIHLYLGNGIPLHEFFKINSENETLSVHEGFIKLETDLKLDNNFQFD